MKTIDPDENLEEQRRLAARIIALADKGRDNETDYRVAARLLAGLFEDLDEHLATRGSLPKRWAPSMEEHKHTCAAESSQRVIGPLRTVEQIEQLTRDNEELIRKRTAEGRPLPKMYENDDLCAPRLPETCEDPLLNAEACLARKFADVEELVAWRAAELRVAGENAKIGAFGYAFVCVVRGDGKIEQPERAEYWKGENAE